MGDLLRIITQYGEAIIELKRLIQTPHPQGDRVPVPLSDLLSDEVWQAEITRVQAIVERVKQDKDLALLSWPDPQPTKLPSLRVSGSELDAAYQQISKDLLNAIQATCRQLELFHRQQLPKSWVKFGEDEIVWAQRHYPVKRAGLYVTGRRGSRLSNLLMQAIPAKIAQVPQVVLVTPPGPEAKIAPDLLVAAQEAGIQEIYRLEGAKAIAALAYGTETIAPVEVLTGVGDWEVSLAKQMVNTVVNTDSPLNRSYFMIVADSTANPSQIALDLLAQVEQDPNAPLVLITSDLQIAEAVQTLVREHVQSQTLDIWLEKAISHSGLIVVVENLTVVIELINQFPPYYLLVAVEDAWGLIEKIPGVSTILIGQSTPKAIADYFGGSNFLLNNQGTFRSAATVSVGTFLKPSNLIEYSPQAFKKLSQTLETLVKAEGLENSQANIQNRIHPPTFTE